MYVGIVKSDFLFVHYNIDIAQITYAFIRNMSRLGGVKIKSNLHALQRAGLMNIDKLLNPVDIIEPLLLSAS